MANHKSAAKRARQSIRKTLTNNNRKSSVRTSEKHLTAAIAAGKVAELPTLLQNFMSQISKAAKNGVFKRETASRKVSRLSARVHATLTSKGTATEAAPKKAKTAKAAAPKAAPKKAAKATAKSATK